MDSRACYQHLRTASAVCYLLKSSQIPDDSDSKSDVGGNLVQQFFVAAGSL